MTSENNINRYPLRPPFSSWADRQGILYSTVCTESQYKWDKNIPSRLKGIKDFDTNEIAHLTCTLIDLESDEFLYEINYYFAGGSVLKKIKSDFKTVVIRYWQIARKFSPSFPHHTFIDLDIINDPFIHCQPKYFSENKYLSIKSSSLHKSKIKACFNKSTDKNYSNVWAEIFYDENGCIVAFNSGIWRDGKHFQMRVRSCKKRLYISKIWVFYEYSKRKKPLYIKQSIEFEGGYDAYESKLIKLGLKEPKKTKAKKIAAPTERKEYTANRNKLWTEEENNYIANHSDMTNRELANYFGVTIKSIEHKKARLRKSK